MQQQQQRNMQFLSLQKPLQTSIQKVQQRQGPSGQSSGAQTQTSAVSLNIKTDQILNQLQTLACNTQAQTENSEKLQQRLQKSEEILESQKRQNQALRMENGKIVEQLRLSKCSMEQLEVQVQTLVSNVEDQRVSAREIQKKLSLAESKYEQSKMWRETLESRLEKAKISIEDLRNEHSKRVSDLRSEVDSKNNEIDEKHAEINQGKLELENLQNELDEARRMLNDKSCEITRLEIKVRDQDAQLKSVEIQMDESKRTASDLKSQVDVLQIEKIKLSQELVVLENGQKESAAAYESNLKELGLRSEEQIRVLKSQIVDQDNVHNEEKEKLQEILNESNQHTQKLAMENEKQRTIILENAEELKKQKAAAEDYLQLNEGLKLDLACAANKITELQTARIISEQEKILEENAIYELQSSLETRMQELEVLTHDIESCCNNLISNDLSSSSQLKVLVAARHSEQKESQQKLDEVSKKYEELKCKSNNLERSLKEAEHKADEKIKLNLFEAQKHINSQLIAMREEHTNAVGVLVAESKSLKEKLAASEKEAVGLRNSIGQLQKVDEQNDKLRTELLQESCRVEQLSKELDEQSQRFSILEKEYQLLKINSPTSLTEAGLTTSSKDVRKTLFISPISSKEISSQKELEEISNKTSSSQKNSAPTSTPGSSGSHILQANLNFDTSANEGMIVMSGSSLAGEHEHDAGGAMKKRALGTSNKSKNANKRAAKKQREAPLVEPATLKKSSHLNSGKSHDIRAWDDNCAEFDLFGT